MRRMWHKVDFQQFNRFWFGFLSPRLIPILRLKSSVCPTILSIAGWRIVGFIPFPRVLVLCEMQTASSKIWTWVATFISYNIHCTTSTWEDPYMTIFINYNNSDSSCPAVRGYMWHPAIWIWALILLLWHGHLTVSTVLSTVNSYLSSLFSLCEQPFLWS